MYFKTIRPLSICIFLCVLSLPACAASSETTVSVRVQEPERGKEACYFNETPYYIGVDFEEGVIEVCPEKKIIFYPPDRCDPAFPHQVRFVVRCLNGDQRCMKEGDLVIIRPKERRGDREDKDRWNRCKPAEDVTNRYMCSHQKSPIELAMPTDEERKLSYEQRHTMFNAESKGIFVIPHTARTAASGIPNPDFGEGASLGWYFNIELQRDGKTIACVDPDIWIERDKG